MKLSIIIVNYNVKFFLEQCLHSVNKALQGISAEVFVVDNNSVDGSVGMLNSKFPDVQKIFNKENVGFSKANNQAIKQAKGEYVLLLNPDTLVEESTFEKVIAFMDNHSDAGGLGVKMIDGKGNFLPESKRGLPTPKAAFYKIFGLSKLFPNSKTFNEYHLGYLNNNETNEIDILSGAFMLLRKSVIDKIGMLDETFFMYGEDIDLSYRITQAGFKNYYFPETRIIHYKGESTKKGSMNYVRTFYKAMKIFNEKHFSGSHAKSFSLLINTAIYLRAFLSLISRFIAAIYLPLVDAIILFTGMYLLTNYWEVNVKALNYPPQFMLGIVPLYILTWISSSYLYGAYDKPIKLSAIVRGVFSGTMLILIIYSLLPETLRYSRALILIGGIWAGFAMVAWRWILNLLNVQAFKIAKSDGNRVAVVAEQEEGQRIISLLNMTGDAFHLIGLINPNADSSSKNDSHIIGSLNQLDELVSIYNINEIIFASKNMSIEKLIGQMQKAYKTDLEFKIAPENSTYIIGSNSIHNSGDLY
ncbi:MAG: glycosyltransferase family 2 protein, partial [Bacteroidia bacterium]|nr:glycosyltransferase family 2 protein [Bacteroidia bacterium]